LTPRELEILKHIVAGKSNKEIAADLNLSAKYRCGPPCQYHGDSGNSQNGRAGGLRDSKWSGESAVNRRDFLFKTIGAGLTTAAPPWTFANPANSLGFRLADVTNAAEIQFRHNSGAYGGKLLPETLGAGCAFLDYDIDGWQDILLVNGNGLARTQTPSDPVAALPQQPQRHIYGRDAKRRTRCRNVWHGSGRGDYNNDGFPDIFITCVGQSRLFAIPAKELSLMPRVRAVSSGVRASVLPRCGLTMTGMACWTFLYATTCAGPRARCLLQPGWCAQIVLHAGSVSRGYLLALPQSRQRNFRRRDRTSGIFDSSSKSLGVAMFDYDQDGWPDLLVANDTQPNKL